MDVFKENVIFGNDALMKCVIPSFVADLVTLDFWLEIETGREIRMGTLHGKLIMTSGISQTLNLMEAENILD